MIKKRIGNLIKYWSILLAVLLLYALFVRLTGLAIPCLFNLVTHLNCPGCGISRFCMHILALDWGGALHFNYLAPLIVVYIAYIIIYISIKYLRTGSWSLNPKPAWLNYVVLGIIIVWWVVRNILKV